MKSNLRFLFLVLAGLGFSIMVAGQDQHKREGFLSKLISPGPLIAGHADLEGGDCLKCHDTGKGVPDSKCLDCHKEIRVSVEMKRDFHGLTKNTCIQCHTDHKGREFDSTLINEKTFNHDLTGYRLVGEHTKLKCTDCHTEKRTKKPIRPDGTLFFGKSASCVSCHKKDDVHFFKAPWDKKDCYTCHSETSWKKEIKFDHKRDAKYELLGEHAKIKCADCHITKNNKPIYKWPGLKQKQCLACHQDVHGKNLSAKFHNGKCQTCHGQDTWAIPKFNHSVTKYPLRGKHAELKCTDCHKQESKQVTQSKKHYKWVGLSQACLSCHKDYHMFNPVKSKKFGNLNQCLNCHTEESWKDVHTFDHNKHTRYPIDGKHREVACKECHIIEQQGRKPFGRYQWPLLNSKTCENCHDSPHKKTFSPEFLKKKCTECHITDDWFKNPKDKSKFNHDETRFKLTGQHLRAQCTACHTVNKKDVYKFPSFEKQFCVDCHKTPHNDQFHAETNQRSCNDCHTTKDFHKLKTFDHTKTRFALKGAHQTLKCSECHTETNKGIWDKKKVTWHKYIFPDLNTKACLNCHKDYHDGQLSANCATCHSEKEWKNPYFDHNKHSQFKLLGKHADVKCAECHMDIKGKTVAFGPQNKKYGVTHFKPMKTDCNSCHAKDDPHHGSFGSSCNRCHIEKGWKITKDFHKNFTLRGQHFTLNCNECHMDDRRLAGMSENCQLCHQKDDVHRGTLPNCKECHRQEYWEQPRFQHAMVYPLRGAHRSLECFECHKNGVYRGTPTDCVACHRTQAPGTHTFPAYNNCYECHNRFTFERGP